MVATTRASGEPVTVAACQIPASIEAPERDTLARAVRAAAARGARLIVAPELAVCGYAFRDAAEARAAAEPLDGPTVTLLCALSRELGCVLVAGLAERGVGDAVHNTAVLVEAGRLQAAYRKAHLWGREPELFVAGAAPPPVVATAAGRIAVLLCYDLEFPEWVRSAAQAGAEIVAVPANWPRRPGPVVEPPLEVLKARVAAATYRTHVVVADRCGTERGVSWFGASVVCDTDGALLAGPPAMHDDTPGPALLTATVDPVHARDKSLGPHNDALGDRRPELYTERGSGHPAVSRPSTPPSPDGPDVPATVSLGGWLHVDSVLTAEIMAGAGFDWCCIDLQHGLTTQDTLVPALAAVAGAGLPAWVRVRADDLSTASWILDMGADAVVVPQVSSPEQARAALGYCLYPPAGHRSSGPTRARLRTGGSPAPQVHLMIEDAAGVAAADEICAVPGVAGIVVGPADLALSLCGDASATTAEATLDAAAEVAAACHRHGVGAGVFCGRAEDVGLWVSRGFTTLALAADSALLTTAAHGVVMQARRTPSG